MLRVLFFVGTLGAGGLERFVTRTCIEAKRARVFLPMVCCLNKREGIFLQELESASIPVYEAPQSWQRNLVRLIQFRRMVQRLQPDIVHSMVNFSLAQQSMLTILQKRFRLFITERNCYPLTGWARLRKMIQYHWLVSLGINYSANGKIVAEHLANLVKGNANKIGVIPNGVSLIPEDKHSRKIMRAQLDINADEILCGCVARFSEHKGYPLLIQTMHILMTNGKKIKMVFIGDGPQREEIEKSISNLGLKEKIKLTGIVNEIERYLQAIDIFILLSEREGMPNAIMEAMAAGKCVVATRVGAVPELINHHDTGILLEHRDPEYVAQILEGLVEHPALIKKLGENAREFIVKNYSIEQVLGNLIHLYSS